MEITFPGIAAPASANSTPVSRSGDGVAFERLLGDTPLSEGALAGRRESAREGDLADPDMPEGEEAADQTSEQVGDLPEVALQISDPDPVDGGGLRGAPVSVEDLAAVEPGSPEDTTAPEDRILEANGSQGDAPQDPQAHLDQEQSGPADALLAPASGPTPAGQYPEEGAAGMTAADELTVSDAEPEMGEVTIGQAHPARETPVRAVDSSVEMKNSGGSDPALAKTGPTAAAATPQAPEEAGGPRSFAALVSDARTDNPLVLEVRRENLSQKSVEVQALQARLGSVTLAEVGLQPQHLRAAAAQLPQPAASLQELPAAKSPIVRQVADQVAQIPSESGTTTIRLKPHGMGVIEISIERSKAGRLDVDMRVQNPLVLEAMRNERAALSHLFQPQGNAGSGTLTMDLFQSGEGRNGHEEQRPDGKVDQNAPQQETDPVADEDVEEGRPLGALPKEQSRPAGGLNILT